jgi:hypothetical protein
LNTGDNRIKQAFMLNNVIHYVFSSYNATYNNSSLVYARYNISKNTLNYKYITASGINYSYPSICSMAPLDNTSDNNVLIGYLRSNASLYPEMAAISCSGTDGSFIFSSSTLVKQGTSAANTGSGATSERWGDYTGMARACNTNNAVFAGSFGNNGSFATYLAEIGFNSTKTSIEEVSNQDDNTSVYPNPVLDLFTVKFRLSKPSAVNISLYDMQGRLTEVFYNAYEGEGPKSFSFNKAGGLAPGMYSLKIMVNNKLSSVKKVVIE